MLLRQRGGQALPVTGCSPTLPKRTRPQLAPQYMTDQAIVNVSQMVRNCTPSRMHLNRHSRSSPHFLKDGCF